MIILKGFEMVQRKLSILGPGRYSIPEDVDLANCIVFFNGRYIEPNEDYRVKGTVVEVSGPCLATDKLCIVEVKPVEVGRKKGRDV